MVQSTKHRKKQHTKQHKKPLKSIKRRKNSKKYRIKSKKILKKQKGGVFPLIGAIATAHQARCDSFLADSWTCPKKTNPEQSTQLHTQLHTQLQPHYRQIPVDRYIPPQQQHPMYSNYLMSSNQPHNNYQ